MYERHFGMTGPPFRLSPDPSFFFDSEQHRVILSTMRRAFARDLPILVVSGEMGAGKTTLLRAWLDECRADGVTVSHLVNTQLDSEELLWAVSVGFGSEMPGGETADPRPALRDFLRKLHDRDGTALLVIDEAQNLSRESLDAVVGLVQMAKQEGAVLRVCLAGQPELRQRVAEPALLGLRALVHESCHLGPLGLDETRRYIEHRLLKVGWVQKPSFDAAAFAEIQRVTAGVPRRINVLCNRLLLTEFLQEGTRIDVAAVTVAAAALEAELEEGSIAQEPATAEPSPSPFARLGQGVLLVIANGRSDHIKAISLLASFAARRDLPPAVVVSTSDADIWALNEGLLEGERFAHVSLARATDAAPALGHIGRRFAQMIEQCLPCAVVVFDGNAVTQMCATLAHERGVPLAHIGSLAQSAEEATNPSACRASIGRLAAVRFDGQPGTRAARQGPHAGLVPVGNLLIDSVRFAVQKALDRARAAREADPAAEAADDRVGYGVVVLRQSSEAASWTGRPELVAMLRAVSRDLPLVWPMRRANLPVRMRDGLARALEGYRVACIAEMNYLEFIDLLLDATCVFTDSPDVIEEAAALRLPCLSLDERHVGQQEGGAWLPGVHIGLSATRATRAVWEILFSGAEQLALPPDWDGHAGARISAQLAGWLRERPGVVRAISVETSTPPT